MYFDDGKAALLTISARPPICLKCSKTGHVRKTCPSNTYHSYSGPAKTAVPGMQEQRRETEAPASQSVNGESATRDREADLPEVDVDTEEERDEGEEDAIRYEVMDDDKRDEKKEREESQDSPSPPLTPNRPNKNGCVFLFPFSG